MAGIESDSRLQSPGSPLGCARGCLARLEHCCLLLGMLSILGICTLITLSILMRTFATSGIPDEVVLVGDMMIGALTLPLAFVAASRGFICIEIFTQFLGPRWQLALNVLTALVGVVAVLPITYAGYLSMVDAFESGSYYFGLLKWPKWPGYTVFFIGYCLFFIRLVDLAVCDGLAALGVIGRGRSTAATGEQA